MSSLSSSRSHPADHVIGVLPRPRRQHWLLRPMLHYTRVLAAALLGASVGLGLLAGATHSGLPHSRAAARPSAVKRPLPDGMSERDVVKWVPLRQPSGRTELAPWTSTDAQLVHDPQVLKSLIAPAPAEPAASASDNDLARLEEESKGAAKSAATPKPAATESAKREKPSPPLPATHALALNRATGSLLPVPPPSSTPFHGSQTTRGTSTNSAGATEAQGAGPTGRRPSLAAPPSAQTAHAALSPDVLEPPGTEKTHSQPVSPHPQPAQQPGRPPDDVGPQLRPQ